MIGVLGAYTHGACLCGSSSSTPRSAGDRARERCTALYGVPTMFLAELEDPEFARFDLTSLRTGVMAGSLCPEPLMRRVIDRMHVSEMTIVYGLTEASPGLTQTPRDRRLTAARRPSAACCPRSRCTSSIPRPARPSRPAPTASSGRAATT